MKKTKIALLLILLLVPFLGACSHNKNQLTIVGSTALQPLAEEAGYQYGIKHNVTINVQGGGTGTGLSQVSEKAVNIGNSDLFAQQKQGIDSKKLLDYKVAVVGIAVITNSTSGVKNVTMDQLRNIFAGKITNWKQVGGKDLPIVLIHRSKGSGTRFTFEQDVMHGQPVAGGQEQDSNGSVQKIVAATPGAISYLAFAYANKKNLVKLEIDGVKPTKANVTNNNWKIWSYEHMYLNKKANNQLAKKFINYIESPKIQTSIIEELGYISIHQMKVSKDINGKVRQLKGE